MSADKELIINDLCRAQDLLARVYDYAIKNDNGTAESAMSCADSCILEALDAIENFGGV